VSRPDSEDLPPAPRPNDLRPIYGSGYIGDEVKHIITTDPAVAGAIEAGISALIASVPVMWWRLAKRLGLPT
jgi:hypothetical protein